jgi:hypothetical protein
VAGALVAKVERYGIAGEKPAHELRQGRESWAEQKMEMIRHQRPGETFDVGLLREILKASDEIPAVIVVQKYAATFDPTNNDVLKQTRYVKTCCTWRSRTFEW